MSQSQIEEVKEHKHLGITFCKTLTWTKIVGEYDQEILQLQTAGNPMAPRGRAAQPSPDTRKTN